MNKPKQQMAEVNSFGQPLGKPVRDWKGVDPIDFLRPLHGSEINLVPVAPEQHVDGLLESFAKDDGTMWTYMNWPGPYTKREALLADLRKMERMRGHTEFYTIIKKETGKGVGFISYLRNFPEKGSIEIGHVTFSPDLRRSRASTEVIYVMMEKAFDAGYRRLEWKCDSLNERSIKAALRYGFIYEGVTRNAVAYTSHRRTRDSSWLSISDSEWKNGLKEGIKRWLDFSNFEPNGQQRKGLAEFVKRDPHGKLDLRVPRQNQYGQPIGKSLPDWTGAAEIDRTAPIVGKHVKLVPVDPSAHAETLFENFAEDDGSMWTYLSYGGESGIVPTKQKLYDRLSNMQKESGVTWFYTIIDQTNGRAQGWVSFSQCMPKYGVVEIGDVTFSPALRNTTGGTEVIYLMLERAFRSGLRRVAWSCDVLNARSRKAAKRLGFTYELIFRQAAVISKRNRDTAWYSMLDSEWESNVKQAYESWLGSSNFDSDGKQKKRLQDFMISK